MGEETLYVLNKNEVIIAVFNKEDEETLINPEIEEKQNSEAILTFQVQANNQKWKDTYNPENLYLVDGKIFSANFSDCIKKSRTEDDEEIILVTAYERQKLLQRKYVRAWNSETGFENIDTFMVVILSGGNLDLKNNGIVVPTTYPKGSSGYVLQGLLYGTGWSVGICDIFEYENGELVTDTNGNAVYQKFDLETDQETIYDNILKVQELWGGILVFDSINKIVHHRDETAFLPYSGYNVKYQKNLVTAEYIGDNKIITKLCPLGEGSLNIKSVNEGSEWLTNFSFTDSIYEAIENNDDIVDSNQLKRWGERKLQSLCKPRKELTVTTALLNKSETLQETGFGVEEVGLNDIVDVIDYEMIENKTEQLRVVSFRRKIWNYDNAELVLSDITLDSTDIFRKSVQATNLINNGTLNTSKVIDYYKNGQSLKETLRQVDETIINTKSELSKADDEIRLAVTETQSDVDNLNNVVVSQSETISELEVGVGKIETEVKSITDLTRATGSETGEIIIEDAVEGELLELTIYGNNEVFKDTTLSEDTILGDDTILTEGSTLRVSSKNFREDLSNINLTNTKIYHTYNEEESKVLFYLYGEVNNNTECYLLELEKDIKYNIIMPSKSQYNLATFTQDISNYTLALFEELHAINYYGNYDYNGTEWYWNTEQNNIIEITGSDEEKYLLLTCNVGIENIDIFTEFTEYELYNLTSYDLVTANLDFNNHTYNTGLQNCRSLIYPITGGYTYEVTKRAGSRFALGTFFEKPYQGLAATNYISTDTEGENETNLSILANETDKYLVVFFYDGTLDSTPLAEMTASIINNLSDFGPLKKVIVENTLPDETIETIIYRDKLVISDGMKKIHQEISKNGEILENPREIILGKISIKLVENYNSIKILSYAASMQAIYTLRNKFNDTFASKIELETRISQTDSAVKILAQQSVNNKNIIASLNVAVEEGQGIVELKGNTVIIKSDDFELTSNGTIKSTAGDIADFKINQNGFSRDIDGIYNFTLNDVSLIFDYIREFITLPQALFDLYDINDDGRVNVVDAVSILNIIKGTAENTKTIQGTVSIIPNDSSSTVLIKKDDIVKTFIGLFNLYSYMIRTDNLYVGEFSSSYTRFQGVRILNQTKKIEISDQDKSIVLGMDDEGRCVIYCKTGDTLKIGGTIVFDTSNIECVDVYAVGDVTSNGGYCMHGTDKNHKYSVNWGTQLAFYVDGNNIGSLSDERLKENIKGVEEKVLKAIETIETKQFNLKNRPNITSIGIIAQELIAAFEEQGLNYKDYNLISEEKYNLEDETLYYVVNYEQFLILKTKCLEERTKTMQNELTELKEMLKNKGII